ncbi:MAG: hypothetical protein GXP49_17315 [Deltaproteobacteria bacterium]|nr:hypothetical protein [Deltaproteobacteria bacterium]
MAILARDLAHAARHVPKAAQHAQAVVGWAGVIESRAKDPVQDRLMIQNARIRCRTALCRTVAEIMAEWLGPALIAMSCRKFPPPMHYLLSNYPPEIVTRITPDIWRDAWDILRGDR